MHMHMHMHMHRRAQSRVDAYFERLRYEGALTGIAFEFEGRTSATFDAHRLVEWCLDTAGAAAHDRLVDEQVPHATCMCYVLCAMCYLLCAMRRVHVLCACAIRHVKRARVIRRLEVLLPPPLPSPASPPPASCLLPPTMPGRLPRTSD